MNIYVASSWKNERQPGVVDLLRAHRHAVFDFRHPCLDDEGFHWSEIDPDWESWTAAEYRAALDHPVAQEGFRHDFCAMEWADACVLVLPCGRSAHLEAGWLVGAGTPLVILLDAGEVVPELMYRMARKIALDMSEVVEELRLLAGFTDSRGGPEEGGEAMNKRCKR
ncbi:MAG TPA: hypothetical protein VM182_10305 [Terriglobia bacterium]|nr:hypothetical protein [Terriglobia bacterium]